MSSWLIPLDVLARKRGGDDIRLFGGKAVRLIFLTRNEFSVPEASVVTSLAFSEALKSLPDAADPKSLLRAATTRTGASRIAEAREVWLRATLPEGLEDELSLFWEEVRTRWPFGVAVRASPTCEDGSLLAMSGLGHASIGIRSGAELASAVRDAWASLASPRGLSYLASRGVKDLSMAVILQRAIAARSSGTMFTDSSGLRVASTRERVINSTFGLGASAARGVAAPPPSFDILRIDSRGRVVESILAHKEHSVRIANDSGSYEESGTLPDEPSLRAIEIDELARVAARLERLEAGSWSIDFACADSRVWVLQARPLTNPAYPDGGDAETVWSNANVGEALPRVVTPLTWSIIARLVDDGVRDIWKTFGCSVPKSAHLITSVHGRIYINLSQLFRTALQIPLVDPHTFLDLGGGFGGAELVREIGRATSRGFVMNLPFSASKIAKMQLSLAGEVAKFDTFAEQEIRVHQALDLAILPDEGVARTLRDIHAIVERAVPLLLSCTATLVFVHLALRKALDRIAPLTSDALAQSIVGGARDIDSARPGMALVRVADIARHEPLAFRILSAERPAPETLASLLRSLPEGPTKRALEGFFETYGDRGIFETELAAPRWSEEPKTVLSMLRVALRDPSPRGEFTVDSSHAAAETALEELVQRLGFVEQLIVRQLRATARRLTQQRERVRSLLTRILGALRGAALEADRRISRKYPSLALTAGEAPASSYAIPNAFFLTYTELTTHLKSPQKDTVALIRSRRADYEKATQTADPAQTFVGAPPPLVMPPTQAKLLRGLPACGGTAEGRARVILHAEEVADFQPGEVLVTRCANVGWTPLFLMAAAVVTEQGGALSHAAVVAREYGVPCVVNLQGATLSIATGDHVRVDGGRGVVEPMGEPGPFA